jgi:hypothetical protein
MIVHVLLIVVSIDQNIYPEHQPMIVHVLLYLPQLKVHVQSWVGAPDRCFDQYLPQLKVHVQSWIGAPDRCFDQYLPQLKVHKY